MHTGLTVSQLVERLSTARQGSPRRCQIDGIHCMRVGRNDVWRVTLGGAVLFVTYCQNDGEFHRRLAGIELTETIARDNPNIAAARLEAVIAESGVIVVQKAPGIAADRLFRLAYRIDKNPFRGRAARGRFLDALASITDFLRAMHQSLPASREHLWDHGPESVVRRVTSHLDRLSQTVARLRGLRVPALPYPSNTVSDVVLGDVTLGNFLIDGSRVMCVDFEDLGFGEPRRDFVLLNESLKRALGQWYYWSDDFRGLVPMVQPDDPWCAMYALEAQLLRVWPELKQPRQRARLRREVEAARRQLLMLNDRVGRSN
jgi:hypothetical protein